MTRIIEALSKTVGQQNPGDVLILIALMFLSMVLLWWLPDLIRGRRK